MISHLVITFEDEAFKKHFEYLCEHIFEIIKEDKISLSVLEGLINSILNTACILFQAIDTVQLKNKLMYEDISYLLGYKIYYNGEALYYLKKYNSKQENPDILVYLDIENNFYIVR